MGRVRPASATSEAIEAEVLLKVWDVLHPRAVGMWASAASGGGGPSERSELTAGGLAVAAEGSGLRVLHTSNKCAAINDRNKLSDMFVYLEWSYGFYP